VINSLLVLNGAIAFISGILISKLASRTLIKTTLNKIERY